MYVTAVFSNILLPYECKHCYTKLIQRSCLISLFLILALGSSAFLWHTRRFKAVHLFHFYFISYSLWGCPPWQKAKTRFINAALQHKGNKVNSIMSVIHISNLVHHTFIGVLREWNVSLFWYMFSLLKSKRENIRTAS